MKRALLLGLAVCTLSGCREDIFQRMEDQPKYLPYQSNEFYEDGRAMRTPPPNTVSREAYANDRLELRGNGPSVDAGYAVSNPLPVNAELLKKGRRHFEVYCATCHGLLGDGKSVVAENMPLRTPPSLHEKAQRPDGYFYDAITYGYGIMPNYSEQLSATDRWAVVAYVRALQLSQRSTLDSAPPAVREQLLKEATP
ncbi:MAG: c-type cytochrome [Myxococcaceae bacterium]